MPDSPSTLIKTVGLFHVSEEAGIRVFEPRPSPSFFEQLTGDVVFAIGGALLHNYLLPRDCPRITWYANADTSAADKERYMGATTASHVMVVGSGWYERIARTTLYCYEFPADGFTLLDACAGYHISYRSVEPIAVRQIPDILTELLSRNIELRFTPSLTKLAGDISRSTLSFSNIRMRNAAK